MFARLACLLLLLPIVAGCGRRQDDRETVVFWVMGYEGEIVAQLLPEFERRNPGIHVDLQQMPVLSAHEKLLTAFAGDSLPDVTPLGNTWIPEFALLGVLDPLDDEIAATPHFDAGDFYPGAWDSGVIDGKTYAVPWYVETRIPFYRVDLLHAAGIDKPPTNWDEWRVAMAAVKREVGPKRYAILLPLNEFEPLLNLAIQQPDPLLRDNGRYGNFRSAGFKRTLAFYKEIFDKDWAPKVANTAISNVWDEFGNGYYTFYINGPWNIAEFKKRLPASLANAWMTMPLPGPDGPGASVAGGTSFVVFRESRHKAAAWKLIAYLSSPEVQVKFHALTGDLPPRRSPWQSPSLADDPYARAYRIQLERAISTPKVPEWERIATELRLIGEQVANDRMSVDDAATELDRRTDAILEKRRWMLDQEAAAGSFAMKASTAGWAFTAPALTVIALFFFLPVLAALALSVTDFDIYALSDIHNLRFVGLGNYIGLLHNPLFWKTLGNTLYFVVVGVPLSIAVSLGAALLLHSKLGRFQGFFRTAFFAPVVTTVVAVAVIWRYLFHTRYGLVNWGLSSVGIDPIDWLGDPHWAMPTIILFAVWKNFGYNMIIFLAGLQSIPEDLYEAARIDGASVWKQFRFVTLPMLGPVLLLVSILTMAGYFQLFAEPYVMTQGGPLESTKSVLYLMYEEGFKWWNLGNASAVAFLLFILMTAVTSGLFWFARRKGAE